LFATISSDSSRTTAKRVDPPSSVLSHRHRTSPYDPQYLTDATHIFDGLSHFPTHVAHMRFGSFVIPPTPWPFDSPFVNAPSEAGHSFLYTLALHWLKEDRDHRRELERQGVRLIRGARNDVRLRSSSHSRPHRLLRRPSRLTRKSFTKSTEWPPLVTPHQLTFHNLQVRLPTLILTCSTVERSLHLACCILLSKTYVYTVLVSSPPCPSTNLRSLT
jgi:hypothetical protein